ncbi:transposable element Tcb2 transposase [Trichonephila clavipes]|nr:transposable element Tcb2 transposase [Trichonephila clavipes]
MITNFFIPELNNHDVQELWFQQDGATCHTARATIDLLKDTFGDRLISRFGPVNWPPRSCDLTPLGYFLWGYVKSLVYADKTQTLENLEDNIRRVIADIRPQMLEKFFENRTSRLDYIRANRGSHMPEIIFKIEAGWSNRRIGRHLGRSDMVVARCWQQWITEGRVYHRGGAIKRNHKETTDRSWSRSRRPLRRLPLTPHYRQCRLDFCRPRATWSVTDWRRVIFSDEQFSLSADDHRTRVWRRTGQRSDPAFIVERHTAISQGVTVWGAISWDTRSSLVVLQGTLTARRYVDDILTPIVLPMLSSRPGAIYQQDNARPHTARLSQQCLRGYDVLPWPARSPDLSPIEHVWNALGRQLQPFEYRRINCADAKTFMAGSSTGGHK